MFTKYFSKPRSRNIPERYNQASRTSIVINFFYSFKDLHQLHQCFVNQILINLRLRLHVISDLFNVYKQTQPITLSFQYYIFYTVIFTCFLYQFLLKSNFNLPFPIFTGKGIQ